jgi:uncharacterized protein YbjQ (UPF0145 family)
MYKAVFISLSLIIASCATMELPSESTGGFLYDGYDFREYADKGILLTTTPPEGNYLSRGLVQITLLPEVKEISFTQFSTSTTNGKNLIAEVDGKVYSFQRVKMLDGTNKYYRVERTSTKKAIDEMVNTTVEWGGDAIYAFKIESETVLDNKLTKVIRRISGLAVQRQAARIEIIDDTNND